MSEDDYEYEIESEGMLERIYKWIPITCTIKVDRETDKAVHGLVSVYDEDGDIYDPQILWVPKSQSEKPWFICTVLFDEENKVSNRRWKNEY